VWFKLFFSFVAVTFIPLLLYYSTILASIREYYRKEIEDRTLATANMMSGSVSKANYLSDQSKDKIFENEVDLKSRESSSRIIVLDNRCVVLKDSNLTAVGKIYLVPEAIDALRNNNKVSTHEAERAVYAAAAILNGDSEKIGVVLVVASNESAYEIMPALERRILLVTVITACALIALAFFLSRVLLDPMREILRAVKKMSEGHLDQRVVIKGGGEYAEMGQAFNEMAGKLEKVEITRSEFVSNVSHELKTPLSSIKVLTESILLQENVRPETYEEFMLDINSEINRMTNIINDLLSLVKMDRRENALNIKNFELNKLTAEVMRRLAPLAARKKTELVYEEVCGGIMLDGDEMKLSLAISNLIENGIKYTPENGKVKVILDADHQNAFITVSDTGIGIEEEHQNKIFERFYRVDKTRDRETGGTGLGLAITHTAVLLHHGSIKVHSKPKEGAVFVVRLPLRWGGKTS
jgi:signal transduction histidine kinase